MSVITTLCIAGFMLVMFQMQGWTMSRVLVTSYLVLLPLLVPFVKLNTMYPVWYPFNFLLMGPVILGMALAYVMSDTSPMSPAPGEPYLKLLGIVFGCMLASKWQSAVVRPMPAQTAEVVYFAE